MAKQGSKLKNSFPKMTINRKTGEEYFHSNGTALQSSILDFWRWANSDLLNNTTRGILAEYIVATAINQSSGNRVEWDAFDLKTACGRKIEVKSSAYVQTWAQVKPSKIVFGIRPTIPLDAPKGKNDRLRQSDIYIFCVLAEQDQRKIDPLDLYQWDFYVVATRLLDEKLADQKTITLSSLKSLGVTKTDYFSLNDEVQRLEV